MSVPTSSHGQFSFLKLDFQLYKSFFLESVLRFRPCCCKRYPGPFEAVAELIIFERITVPIARRHFEALQGFQGVCNFELKDKIDCMDMLYGGNGFSRLQNLSNDDCSVRLVQARNVATSPVQVWWHLEAAAVQYLRLCSLPFVSSDARRSVWPPHE